LGFMHPEIEKTQVETFAARGLNGRFNPDGRDTIGVVSAAQPFPG